MHNIFDSAGSDTPEFTAPRDAHRGYLNLTDKTFQERFKGWCLSNNLRLKRLEGTNELIAYSPYNKHHLFDGYLDGVGIWIECSSARKATSLARKLEKLGARVRQGGGQEVALYTPHPHAIACAKLLKLVRGKSRGEGFRRMGRERGDLVVARKA